MSDPAPLASSDEPRARAARSGPHVRLLEADPDLGRRLDSSERVSASRIAAATMQLWPGPWEPPNSAEPGAVGLLVLDGLLLHDVRVGGTSSTELIGPGDLLRPWLEDVDGLLSADGRWTVTQPARLALLSGKVATAVTSHPGLVSELLDRVVSRVQRQSVTAAITCATRVDRRLLLVLGHLAERFGHVTPEGVAVRLRLTHATLAEMVGARRPTVTTALGILRRDGLVDKNADANWVVTNRGCDALAFDVA